MDRVLKLVYNNRYFRNGNEEYLLNGVHPAVIKYINDNFTGSNVGVERIISQIQQGNTSSRWSAFFRSANFVSFFKKYVGAEYIVKINEIEDDNALYLYPIQINTSIGDMFEPTTLQLDGITYNYSLIDTIEPEVLAYLRSGKVKLIIDLSHDPIAGPEDPVRLEKFLISNGIDPSNATIVSGNKYEDLYRDFPEMKIRLATGSLLIYDAANQLNDYPKTGSLGYLSDIVRESDLDNTKVRPKRFICLNRNLRDHRYAIAQFAMKHNLLENNIFSFIAPDSPSKEHIGDKMFKYISREEVTEYLDKVISLFPYEIDTHHLVGDDKRGFSSTNNRKDFYINTYVNIISETSFSNGDSRHPFLSEKTFHPIINLQPFVLIGNPYSLHKLHELGFKTFSPWINESYDTEVNAVKRFDMLRTEILKLNNMSLEELHRWYYSITDILLYNQKHLETFKDTNPYRDALNDIRKYYGN